MSNDDIEGIILGVVMLFICVFGFVFSGVVPEGRRGLNG